MKVDKIWTKDFFVIWIIHFIITVIFYLLLVTIGQYAIIHYEVSISVAGLVSGIFVIGSLVGRLIAGRLLTLMSSKKVMIIGLVFLCVTTALYFIQVALFSLMIIRFWQGFAMGITGTAAGTLVFETLPSHRKGEGIGYFSLGGIIGTAIGPFLGIFLTQLSTDFNLIFKVNVLLALICLGSCLLLGKSRSNRPIVSASKRFRLSNYVELNVIPMACIALLIGFSFSGVMSFLTLYTESINLVVAGSYFFLVYALAVILTRPYIGKLFDRAGASIVIYPSLVIFAFGMFLFSTAQSSFIFLLSAACIGVGFGNFNSVSQAFVIMQTPHARIGVATSTYLILCDLGMGAGPFLLGFLEPLIGYRGIFSNMVVVILICVVLYYLLYSRQGNFGKKKMRA
ncbi:MFS transporter [Solibacillus sp. FSL H8-0538]|uniref:MFS transporter n=1 Tax=Solibacillus sp. FSL H8-0538 TaxID=2921400 RepID=UPI0030FAFE16